MKDISILSDSRKRPTTWSGDWKAQCKRLRDLGLLSLEKRKQLRDLLATHSCFIGRGREDDARLLPTRGAQWQDKGWETQLEPSDILIRYSGMGWCVQLWWWWWNRATGCPEQWWITFCECSRLNTTTIIFISFHYTCFRVGYWTRWTVDVPSELNYNSVINPKIIVSVYWVFENLREKKVKKLII